MRSAMIYLLSAWVVISPPAGNAQIFPTPGPETPRVQSVQWVDGQAIVLTAMPETTLTVMLEPGEAIRRASLSGSRAWDV